MTDEELVRQREEYDALQAQKTGYDPLSEEEIQRIRKDFHKANVGPMPFPFVPPHRETASGALLRKAKDYRERATRLEALAAEVGSIKGDVEQALWELLLKL